MGNLMSYKKRMADDGDGVDFNEEMLPKSQTIGEIVLVYLTEPTDLLKARAIHPIWKNTVDKKLRRTWSLKKTIKFKSPVEIFNFTNIFNEDNVLHDCFTWGLDQELKFEDDFYKDFVSRFGGAIKGLDISRYLLTMYKHSFAHLDYTEYSKEMEIKLPIQIMPNLLERMIFDHFPNLVELTINDVINDSYSSLFHPEEERKTMFKSHELTSLRELNCLIHSGHSKKEKALSDEILKIAPNLKKVAVAMLDGRSEMNEKLLLRTLRAISKFGPQIESLSFLTVLFIVVGNIENLSMRDYENLRLKTFNLMERKTISHVHKRFWTFLSQTPTAQTLENLEFASPYLFVRKDSKDLWAFLPKGFQNVKILNMKIIFREQDGVDFLNTLQTNFPYVEEFTTSFNLMLSKFGALKPWVHLKKLFLQDVGLSWTTPGEFYSFYVAIQMFAPNLVKFKITLDVSVMPKRETLMLSYPFFIWLGEKWKTVKKFTVALSDDLIWTKGSGETNLGICVEQLFDKNGNFTTAAIEHVQNSVFSSMIKPDGQLSKLLHTKPKTQKAIELNDDFHLCECCARILNM